MSAFGNDAGRHPNALVDVATNGTRTVLITAALAAGVAVPSMLLRRKKPML